MIKIDGIEMITDREDATQLQMAFDLIRFNSALLGYDIYYDYYNSYRSKDYNKILKWVIKDSNFLIKFFFHLRSDMKLMEINTHISCNLFKLDVDEIDDSSAMYFGPSMVKNFIESYQECKAI